MYMLTSIEHAVKVGTTLSLSWFRGHSRTWGQLTPRVFRPEWAGDYLLFRPDVEFTMLHSFRRSAPAVLSTLPPWSDLPLWLLLMQHHGTPTRLLDWSESVLVALYFAVSADPSEDGELWALYPDSLNQRSGIFGKPTMDSTLVQFLAKEFAHNSPDQLAREMRLEERPRFPLAFQPPLLFPRMVAQHSAFTVHPRPEQGCSMTDLLTEPEHLVRYVIPAEAKPRLRRDLTSLGVTRGSLFPDLDGLSQVIIEEHGVVAYAPPRPPDFSQERPVKN